MDSIPTDNALERLAAELAARPIIPQGDGPRTRLVRPSDLPFIPTGDGSSLQLQSVDLANGIWVSVVRLPPGTRVVKHYHTGWVYGVTLQGSWYYAESPDEVNTPGSFLFEPAGSAHTLMTPADQEGDTLAWFAIAGANINLDEKGDPVSIADARTVLDVYRKVADALGLDTSKLIIIGE